MILGPTGVGKSILAQRLHEFIDGDISNFSHCNLKELPESTIESEIFGSVKGAFTGAEDRMGLFEKANGGTLFIDEIATLSLDLQVKLLNVLQNRSFCRIGSTQQISLNCRLITATCESIKDKIESGEMRQDFFRRIMGYKIIIPALKDRPEDIPPLIKYFKSKNSRQVLFSDEAMNALVNYHWSNGNIGEVKCVVDNLCSLSEKIMIMLSDLPESIGKNQNPYDSFSHSGYLNDGVLKEISISFKNGLKHKELISQIEREIAFYLLNEENCNAHSMSNLMSISWEKAKKLTSSSIRVQ